jgi:hypothetical protein
MTLDELTEMDLIKQFLQKSFFASRFLITQLAP